VSGVISGYTSLQTSVADWLAKSNLTTFIPAFIQNFEERFYRQPRNYGKWMESSALSVSFSSTATIPTDYLGARTLYLNGQVRQPLIVSSLEQLYAKYPRAGSSGIPAWVSRDGANFVFGPVPNGTYTLNGTYYAKPVLLRNFASDAAAHYLIVNAPDLLLYGALLEAVSFIKDDSRIGIWQSFYDRALSDYRDLQKNLNFSGGSMQVMVA
jgi:hypothetical protein